MLKKSLTLILLVTIGSFVVITFIFGGITAYDTYIGNLQIPEKVAGEVDHQKKVEYQKMVQETIEESGIADIYETISKFDDTRELLYEQKDFTAVTERLTQKFQEKSTPLERMYYSGELARLGNYTTFEDPLQNLDILNQWLAVSPDSHFPYTARGVLYRQYAWHFRGSRLANQVTDEGWKKFEHYLELALADLEKAHEMEPADPEPLYHLISTVAGLGYGTEAIEHFYQKVMDVEPLHYGARLAKLNFIQPKWGGSWEAMEALEKDCEEAGKEFPLLLMAIRSSKDYMQPRGTKYVNAFQSSHQRWLQVALDQLAQDPNDTNLRTNVIYMAFEAQELVIASEHFEIIGDKYMEDTRFDNLQEYSEKRAYCLLAKSREPGIAHTPEEGVLIKKAYKIGYTNEFVKEYYNRYMEHETEPETTEPNT